MRGGLIGRVAMLVLLLSSWMHAQENRSANDATGGQIPSRQAETTVVTTDPNLLVLTAIRQAVWGPAFTCKVQQSTKAYGQQTILVGDFKSGGLGTGQFRYSVRVAVGETSFDMLQISDGELMWTQCGSDHAPRRVNLRQVRESIAYATKVSDARPEVNLVLAVGGQADLLRALYHRYNWYKAVGGKLSGVDVWQLVGRLRTEVPKVVGSAPIDEENSRLGESGHNLPSEVRLTLSRSASLPYFPYLIEYFEPGRDKLGQPSGVVLVTRIEYSEPKTNSVFGDQDFVYRVSDSIDKIEDETQRYLPRMPIAGMAPFGAN